MSGVHEGCADMPRLIVAAGLLGGLLAAEAAATQSTAAVPEELRQAVQDLASTNGVKAGTALMRLKDQARFSVAALPAVVGLLGDQRMLSRNYTQEISVGELAAEAAAAIGREAEPAERDVLIAALSSDKLFVRYHATQVFKALRDPRATELLLKGVADPEPNIRAASAEALQGEARAFDPLLALLKDPKAKVLGTDKAAWQAWWAKNESTFGQPPPTRKPAARKRR